jgi:carbamoyltransferase
MLVLGVSGGFGHDAGACLVRDGKVLAMLEEERVVRVRHATGSLPIHSTLFCLHRAGATPGDLNAVAISWNPALDPSAAELSTFVSRFMDHEIWKPHRRPELVFIDHHRAHAASAFFASGFEEAALLVVDGNGEGVSTSIGHAHAQHLDLDASFGASQSLGHFYTSVTEYLGLLGHGEGKTMGLAPYGTPSYDFDCIRVTPDGYRVTVADVDALPADERYTALRRGWRRYLETKLGPARRAFVEYDPRRGAGRRELPFAQEAANIAASAQRKLEEIMLHLAALAVKRSPSRSLVLAGGVALNCSVNGALAASGVAERVYVVPPANDAGGALGAALAVAAQSDPVARLQHAYWGPAFADVDIARAYTAMGARFLEPAAPHQYVASLLARGKVVAVFQGAAEVGPRALGHRSIVALPSTSAVRDRVNRIKHREAWRPLSPALLEEAVPEALGAPLQSPYMLFAHHATPEFAERHPAVVHVDGSTRLQTVPPSDDDFRTLLEAVRNESGASVVLNTSFNVGGEPIVSSPGDALRTFACSEIDALLVGRLVLEK